jgi:hypothetical protein
MIASAALSYPTGFAGLDPASVLARGRDQVETPPDGGEIELLFEERPLDKSRSFRNELGGPGSRHPHVVGTDRSQGSHGLPLPPV